MVHAILALALTLAALASCCPRLVDPMTAFFILVPLDELEAECFQAGVWTAAHGHT